MVIYEMMHITVAYSVSELLIWHVSQVTGNSSSSTQLFFFLTSNIWHESTIIGHY